MNLPYLTEESIQEFIRRSLHEDLGDGDHSSLGALPHNPPARARLLVKDQGVIAGIQLAQRIFKYFDASLKVDELIKDGAAVSPGDIAFVVEGSAQSILATERLVLNCMQRMSGIATKTHSLRALIEGTAATLIDTRKTTPNFRLAEKWAVAIGGGTNHRFALYDMVMLKDNHIDMAGGISAALRNTRDYLKRQGRNLKIEVETRSLEEVREVLASGGADIIMLDNMSVSSMKQAVEIINHQCKVEASGGITEQNIRAIAETGVDFISVGALTHSVKSLDLSLKAF